MRIVNGAYRPDAGQVQMSRGTRVGYLPQDPQLDAARPLKREAEQAFADLADLHDQLEQVSHEKAEASDAAVAGLSAPGPRDDGGHEG